MKCKRWTGRPAIAGGRRTPPFFHRRPSSSSCSFVFCLFVPAEFLLTPASENPFGCRLVFLVLTQSFKASWHFAFCFWKFWFGVFFVRKVLGRVFHWGTWKRENSHLEAGFWKRGSGVWVCLYARELTFFFVYFNRKKSRSSWKKLVLSVGFFFFVFCFFWVTMERVCVNCLRLPTWGGAGAGGGRGGAASKP